MSARWKIIHDEPESGRRLDGRKLLEEYDLRVTALSHPKLRWFSEAVRAVKLSIDDGYRAKLHHIDRICVYQELRMWYYSPSGARSRYEETRGVVVPKRRMIFFSRRGKIHSKVLYEETAHGLARPVPVTDEDEEIRFERYKCHLQIYEGLLRSLFSKRLGPSGRKKIERLSAFLKPRCRIRIESPPNQCTCTM